MKRILLLLITVTTVLGMALSAQAIPVQWDDNGHIYDIIFTDDNPTWFEARDAAAALTYNGVSGHLVTVTTAAEQDFLVATFGGAAINQLWVGGYQDTSDPDYTESYGGWKWITGEPWNTGVDAPDFSFNNNYWFIHSEQHLITWWNTGGLNDFYYAPDPNIHSDIVRGYIVEYDGAIPEPCTILLVGTGLSGILAIRRKYAK